MVAAPTNELDQSIALSPKRVIRAMGLRVGKSSTRLLRAATVSVGWDKIQRAGSGTGLNEQRLSMMQLAPVPALTILEMFQDRLEAHFGRLHAARLALGSGAPSFVIEHGLNQDDLDILSSNVRGAVQQGFGAAFRRSAWLPFIVYATEFGYSYSGSDFWPRLEATTPGWARHGRREDVRSWFLRFSRDYGGAVPRGAFARTFRIIAWPITHAVLPVYLQRQLARLLFDFRMALTTALLDDPEELGIRLAARAWASTERFRIFCENTTLLGHLASALLRGDDEQSEFLEPLALRRLVSGLERERDAKVWLEGARHAASRVRARGFLREMPAVARDQARSRVPRASTPKLTLQRADSGWQLFAELPDLSGLGSRMPHIMEDLRTRRARVNGADRAVVARGRLLDSRQELRLNRLPERGAPLVQLENSKTTTNALIRDLTELDRGALWLFECRSPWHAVEVRGIHVRAGGTYLVAHSAEWRPPSLAWIKRVDLDVDDAHAVLLTVPDRLTSDESADLVAAGITVVTDAVVRPVGVVPSSWDGQGTAEWIVGEAAVIGLKAQQTPAACVVKIGSEELAVPWPPGEDEIFLSLDELPVGEHLLQVILVGSDTQVLIEEELTVVVREPRSPSLAGEPGEGIRLLASPARPTLSELWAPDAITLNGPRGLKVEVEVSLFSEARDQLACVTERVTLPLRDDGWKDVATKVRSKAAVRDHYDHAESATVTVRHGGVGHARLSAERGLQPLRWQFSRERDHTFAQLLDRTDTPGTRVELYGVESPLTASSLAAEHLIEVPAAGGLLHAVAGEGIEFETTVLLPTRPYLGMRDTAPSIPTPVRNSFEVVKLARAHKRWADADLPDDLFALAQRDTVLESITSALVSLVCGPRWASLERQMFGSDEPESFVDRLKQLVGDSPDHVAVARAIGNSLFGWTDPLAQLAGFTEMIARTSEIAGIRNPSAPYFLLSLADHPKRILEWDRLTRGVLLRDILLSPVLLRAARFAVLGSRAFAYSRTVGSASQ